MSDSKYRIPRLTVAALVLGACGDDDEGSIDVSEARVHNLGVAICQQYAKCEPTDFAEEYSSQADCVAEFENDIQGDISEETSKCLDAYLDWMDCAASLACNEDEDVKCSAQEKRGDEVCEDDDDGGPDGGAGDAGAGVDVSQTRIHASAVTACRKVAECDPSEFSDEFGSQGECVTAFESDLGVDDTEANGTACLDAYLDWMDCAYALSCSEDAEVKCDALDDEIDDLCESEDDMSSLNPVRLPGLRTPR